MFLETFFERTLKRGERPKSIHAYARTGLAMEPALFLDALKAAWAPAETGLAPDLDPPRAVPSLEWVRCAVLPSRPFATKPTLLIIK